MHSAKHKTAIQGVVKLEFRVDDRRWSVWTQPGPSDSSIRDHINENLNSIPEYRSKTARVTRVEITQYGLGPHLRLTKLADWWLSMNPLVQATAYTAGGMAIGLGANPGWWQLVTVWVTG